MKSHVGFCTSFFRVVVNFVPQTMHETMNSPREREFNLDLFDFSPLPMWLYNIKTLQILDVNKAAIVEYGYTEAEFLSMTIRDIRPLSEVKKIEETVVRYSNCDHLYFPRAFKHRKKSGEIITVDIYSNLVVHNGAKVKVVIAKNITEHLTHVFTTSQQNLALKEIAHLQSHSVRAPVARLMGLVRLLSLHFNDVNERQRILNLILSSANDIDKIIFQITQLSQSTIGHVQDHSEHHHTETFLYDTVHTQSDAIAS